MNFARDSRTRGGAGSAERPNRTPISRLAMASLCAVFLGQAGAQETPKAPRITTELGSYRYDPVTETFVEGARPRSATARGASLFSTEVSLDNLDLAGFVAIDSQGSTWFGKADKGVVTSGGKSEIMTSFVFAYCTSALAANSGGVGGSARITFYENYTGPTGGVGSAPSGTPVAIYNLSGLPGARAGSQACALVEFPIAQPGPSFSGGVVLPDGPIGWSWDFVDASGQGSQAATSPFIVQAATQAGVWPTVEKYDGAGYHSLRFGATAPYSVPLQIREASRVSAVTSVENGTGVNPVILQPFQGPVLGEPWSIALDCTGTTPTKLAVFKLGFGPAPTPLATPFGELLVPTGAGPTFFEPHGGGLAVLGPIGLPVDLAFLGASYRVQGLCGNDPRGYL